MTGSCAFVGSCFTGIHTFHFNGLQDTISAASDAGKVIKIILENPANLMSHVARVGKKRGGNDYTSVAVVSIFISSV